MSAARCTPPAQRPFQTGRSDAQGRIVLLPDRPGTWRIKAYSEAGHGLDLPLEIDAAGVVGSAPRPLYGRLSRVALGVLVLFGIFGVITLVYRGRSR